MSSSDIDERVMTVPLRSTLAGSSSDQADRALSAIREHLAQHYSVDEDAVRMDPSINEAVWANGRTNPPSKIRVRAARFDEDGESVVEAEAAE
ncbi:50S ribosomal protein L31e [Halovenus rubra]|uniref:50S ribosomal protein L31e n=2 Tax=Halovenus rubra TaxID=869890 RepID=A0ACC7E0V3_9EURY|nr:50S ribosomal protein L31e [Halovenus rubra]